MSAQCQRLSPQITFQGRKTRCRGQGWGGCRQRWAGNVHGRACERLPGRVLRRPHAPDPKFHESPQIFLIIRETDRAHLHQVHSFPRAAVSKGHSWGPQELILSASRSRESEVKLWAGPCSLPRPGGGSFLPLPASGGSRRPWLVAVLLHLCLLLCTAVSLCASVQISLFLEDTSHCIQAPPYSSNSSMASS